MAPIGSEHAAVLKRLVRLFDRVIVADTSSRYDREVKLPLYARHGIHEVWIVDLENRCLHVFRDPAEGCYKQVQTIKRPGVMASLQLPECGIDLSALF